MKIMAAGVVASLAATSSARPAHACGVPDFGRMLGDVAISLDGTHEDLGVPVVSMGLGTSTEGNQFSATVGWAWGKRQVGGLFPGSDANRVLVDVRDNLADRKQTSLALTYGWFSNSLITYALDLGAQADVEGQRGVGPTARLTLGLHGLDVRFDGAAIAGPESHLSGSVQFVFDVTEVTGRI